jgi:hypothetical protein
MDYELRIFGLRLICASRLNLSGCVETNSIRTHRKEGAASQKEPSAPRLYIRLPVLRIFTRQRFLPRWNYLP